MNILVTGGTRFIGTNLVKKLQEIEDIQIIVLDNLSYGKKENFIDGVEYITIAYN